MKILLLRYSTISTKLNNISLEVIIPIAQMFELCHTGPPAIGQGSRARATTLLGHRLADCKSEPDEITARPRVRLLYKIKIDTLLAEVVAQLMRNSPCALHVQLNDTQSAGGARLPGGRHTTTICRLGGGLCTRPSRAHVFASSSVPSVLSILSVDF